MRSALQDAWNTKNPEKVSLAYTPGGDFPSTYLMANIMQ